MKPSKLAILLLFLVSVSLAIPYIDIEGNFQINYTGMCINGEPMVGFTCSEDSLNLDSLLEIYPSVSIMDSVVYYQFIELRMEEDGI